MNKLVYMFLLHYIIEGNYLSLLTDLFLVSGMVAVVQLFTLLKYHKSELIYMLKLCTF
jgi:hypothetical protein